MAYETGTYSSIGDLIDTKLKAFCVANGWTVNNDGWPAWLAISKGSCYLNMQWNQGVNSVSNVQDYTVGIQTPTDPFGVSRTDHKVWMHLSSGYSATSYSTQPDSSVDSTATNENHVYCNNLQGPGVAYHFYASDPGDYAFIGVVVETTDDHYMHFYFGEIDKGLMTYSPNAAFLASQNWQWWPNSTSYSTRNDVTACTLNGGNRSPFNYVDEAFLRNMNIYPGGAFDIADFPDWSGTAKMYPGTSAATPNETFGAFVYNMHNFEVFNLVNEISEEWNGTGSSDGSLYTAQMHRPPIGYSGVSQLIPYHFFVPSGGELKTTQIYLGDAPNVFYVSMRGLTAGQEITFGQDVYQCWPLRRIGTKYKILEVDIPASPAILNNSFYHGYAIKKTV